MEWNDNLESMLRSAAESADARVPYDELKRRILQGSMGKEAQTRPSYEISERGRRFCRADWGGSRLCPSFGSGNGTARHQL